MWSGKKVDIWGQGITIKILQEKILLLGQPVIGQLVEFYTSSDIRNILTFTIFSIFKITKDYLVRNSTGHNLKFIVSKIFKHQNIFLSFFVLSKFIAVNFLSVRYKAAL